MIWDSLNRDFFISESSEFSLLSNGQLSGKPTHWPTIWGEFDSLPKIEQALKNGKINKKEISFN